jgi:hypothetical protein
MSGVEAKPLLSHFAGRITMRWLEQHYMSGNCATVIPVKNSGRQCSGDWRDTTDGELKKFIVN